MAHLKVWSLLDASARLTTTPYQTTRPLPVAIPRRTLLGQPGRCAVACRLVIETKGTPPLGCGVNSLRLIHTHDGSFRYPDYSRQHMTQLRVVSFTQFSKQVIAYGSPYGDEAPYGQPRYLYPRQEPKASAA
jgi:hypothetical protein